MSPFLGTRGAGTNKAFGFAGPAAPNQVTGLTATDFGTSRAYNNGRIDLSWTTPDNNGATITGYKIERSTNGSSYSTLVANTSSSATTYSDTGLSSAQIYYYKVSAINAVGTGLASTAANATSTTVPQSPTFTTTDVGTGRAYNNAATTIVITGGATGGKAITGYAATSSGAHTASSSSTTLTVTGLSSGTGYTYTTTATNANGTSAVSSPSGSVTATTVPQAPTIGTVTDGGTGTTVSIPYTAGATGGSAITNYQFISNPATSTQTSTSNPYTFTGLTAGTAYTFTVAAINANGTSIASSASNSVTPTLPPSYESIATLNGTGGTNVLTFSSIPQTYKALQLRIVANDAFGATPFLRFNGDTGNNYATHSMYGVGSSTASASGVGGTNALTLQTGLAAGQNSVACYIIDIFDYTSTSKLKTVKSASTAPSAPIVTLHSGLWNSTSAITSLVFQGGQNFSTTTQVALYGIK